jgi:BlaI family transcriptional regulator, penicillinase repressor
MRVRRISLTYESYRNTLPIVMKEKRESHQRPIPTDAELAVLQVLWRRGASTVREVHDALKERGVGYTTVLKQMQVMTEKGLLQRNERFRSHVYEPQTAQELTQRQLVRALIERAFEGSPKNLVLGALSSKRVSVKELQEIRQLLDAFEREQKRERR